ncbi:MAG TPA: DEAD/DEAH box helicase [Candidatus Obscuribacter sp.]|nr:DEAD/DEAH box helicase [Candidatus Obscuribacter sp.]
MGQVQGSESKPYDVLVHLQENLAAIRDVQCSCPMGGDCKHSAALLLEAIRSRTKAAPERVDKPTAKQYLDGPEEETEAKLSPSLNAWFSEFSRHLSPPKAKAECNSSAALLYLLDVGSDQRLVLNTKLAKRLTNGAWGKLEKIYLDRISGNQEYLIDEDRQIIKLFVASTRSSYSYSNAFPEVPDICKILLEKLFSLNRCFWKDSSSLPLTLGKSKQGRLSWETRDDKKQTLKLLTDHESDITVIAGGPWYVNPASSTFGKIELSLPPEAVRSVLKMPPVAPHEAAPVAKALSKVSAKIPAPYTNFTTTTVTVEPTAHLKLVIHEERQDFRSYSSKKVGRALVSFDYGSKFSRQGDTSEVRSVKDDKITIHKKDTTKEAALLKYLEKYGLVKQIKTYTWQETEFAFPEESQMAWFEFIKEAVPELEEQGWKITRDKYFRFEAVSANDDWQADVVESQDFWFALDLGVMVEGKRMPLLPILQSVLWRVSGDDPMGEIEKLAHKGLFYAPLPDGRHLALPLDRVKSIFEALLELFDRDSFGYMPKQTAQLSLPQLMKMAKVVADHPNQKWLLSDKLNVLFEKINSFTGLAQVNAPKTFKAELRPYQLDGLSWLNFVREFGLGGILADDMGLGKTVQTLAHISYEKSAKRLKKPFLVVCPTSVLPNWMNEIEKLTPSLNALALWGKDRSLEFDKIPKSDIVITTYPLISRDSLTLASQDWNAVVLDEAQMIKNPSTQAAQALLKLKSDYRVCLTGTPVENHLGELWSQFNFLLPGFLGDSTSFSKTFRQPIERYKDKAAQKKLAQRIKPFLLRRTKENVAKDLPEKTSIIKMVELEGAQRDLYETVRLAMFGKVKDALSSKGLAKSQIIILDALLKLRQVCCDPRLIGIPAAKKISSSVKLDLLMNMLDELLAEDRKILLFSQFTSMLDLIIPELEKRKISFVQIRGDTKDRLTPVKEFQDGRVPLFLLSLKAGGLGLNLTAADTVIHYDPWWNPAVENQATDRAHRIGQTKSVFVFKLIAAGTIEERMLELQEKKSAIAKGLYGDEDGLPFKITAEDLDLLFKPL